MKAILLPALLAVSVLASPRIRGGEYVPVQAAVYRARVVREAHAAGGLQAPVALFAAQFHQESRWRTDAKSGAGALGLAQFMPGTAQWIASLYPSDLKPGAPLDPNWAIRALVKYDYWVYVRLPQFQSGDERWAATLSAYNGGMGWVLKDAKLAIGCDSSRWFGCVEFTQDGRIVESLKENRGYPERILHLLRPMYRAAGWGG